MIRTKSAAMPKVFSVAPGLWGEGRRAALVAYLAAVQRLTAHSAAPSRPSPRENFEREDDVLGEAQGARRVRVVCRRVFRHVRARFRNTHIGSPVFGLCLRQRVRRSREGSVRSAVRRSRGSAGAAFDGRGEAAGIGPAAVQRNEGEKGGRRRALASMVVPGAGAAEQNGRRRRREGAELGRAIAVRRGRGNREHRRAERQGEQDAHERSSCEPCRHPFSLD